MLGGVAVAAAGWRVFAVRAAGLALLAAAAGFFAGPVATWRAAALILAGRFGVTAVWSGGRWWAWAGRPGDPDGNPG